ncbi:RNA polymerase sigma factor [candidate division KSB1 bacterium]
MIKSPDKTDSDLVVKTVKGDAGAFKDLFDKYSVPLLDFAFSYLKDSQLAEDIVQDVFVNIWLKKENLNPELSIKSYLYKAVQNQVFKHYRRLKLVQKASEYMVLNVEQTENPDESFDKNELSKIVQGSVEKLPDKCREIFILNRYHDLKYAEIAEIQNISINTVKTQMGRAFKMLRKELAYFLTVLIYLFFSYKL